MDTFDLRSVAAFLVATAFPLVTMATGSPEKGKAAFVSHGCWQCHGFDGQGSVAGARIAPNPLPLETLSAFVRNTSGSMPPYQKAILSDEDLTDIHAYLQSVPKGPDPATIPLLNP